jgi:hypothetical protein
MPSRPERLRRRLPSSRSRAVRAAGAVVVAAVLGPAASAAAATFYVDPASRGGRCSDARTAADNTLARPWCTLRRGLEAVPSGGRLELRAGSHPGVTSTGFTRPAAVTVAPYGAERPEVARIELLAASNLAITGLSVPGGFTVRGGAFLDFAFNLVDARPAGRGTPPGFSLWNVHAVRVRGNVVRDASYGVHVRGSIPVASDVAIERNRFEALGYDGVHVSGGDRIRVAGNEFAGIKPRPDIDAGAHADAIQSEAPTTAFTVADNVVHGGRGFLFMVAATETDRRGYAHRGLTIQNNLLVGPDFGMRLYSTQDLRLVNNTVWGTSDSAHHGVNVLNRVGTANAPTTGAVVANNVFKRFGFAAPVQFSARTGNLIATGAIGPEDYAGAPTFGPQGGYGFGLRPGSKGIDAARAAFAPSLDLAGAARFGAPDVGALEYRP